MSISNWPLLERPREKLLKRGAGVLSEAELLAIFLQTGVRGKTAIDLARDLLHDFNGLSNLLNANDKQILSYKGVGKAKFTKLKAALELGRRYLHTNLEQQKISLNSASAAKEYFIAKLSHYKGEVFACLFLSTHHEIIHYEELFHGTINSAPIFPRIIAQKSLEYNASALILAHNHPSGRIEPSDSDIKSTQNLIKILQILDIRVIDHIIVGGKNTCSFAERKLL